MGNILSKLCCPRQNENRPILDLECPKLYNDDTIKEVFLQSEFLLQD